MMKKWQKPKFKISIIILLLIYLVFGYFFIEHKSNINKEDHYEEMLSAELLMLNMIDYVSKLRKDNSIKIDKELDPNETGLIGKEFSEITTTLGDLEAKQASTNPKFAALMVDYFIDSLSLKSGDKVAVGASGSFPALLLATLAAGEVLDLDMTIIYSLGSSNYGSNILGFTMADIVPKLNSEDYISNNIDAVSLGGGNDTGGGMFIDSKRLKELYSREKWEFIYNSSTSKSKQARIDLYDKNGSPKLFINIGGNMINYGRSFHNSGLLCPSDVKDDTSLIDYYLYKDIPVINLLNIKGLSERHSIKINPQQFLEPGQGRLYYNKKYSRKTTIFILGIYLALLIYFKKKG